MNNLEEKITKENSIRHHFEEKSGEFYFSIVDVIDNLHLSTDPRNYWKVLKNRLKKARPELVTECNQLKMISNDGKYYLTDVANTNTMLQIIELVAPEKVATFGEILDKIERENVSQNGDLRNGEEKLSTVLFEEGEIQVDMYQKEDCVFVRAMLAGVDPDNIFISVDCKNLIIKVSRLKQNNIEDVNFNLKELYWGKFSRIISLPFEVDIDRVEANSNHGLLSIKLSILDKTRTKIIKVK